MKILLVRPRPHKDTIGLQSIMVCEPLELEYLAGALKDLHEVELIDMILEKKPLSYFIKAFTPDVVAITAYISHVNIVKEYAKTIKEISSDIKVTVGGVHAEVVPDDFIDNNIDYIISSDGINNLLLLLASLEDGRRDSSKSTIIDTSTENCQLPQTILPDRTITDKYRAHYYYVFHNPCALIKTSYGCPYTCNFCFCRQITGGRYYERQLEEVIEELKLIKEPEIYIVDDNFLVDRKRVERFCGLLEENNLHKRFLIYGRADFIANNADVMARFAQVGLRAVIVGLESAKTSELENYNKKSSVELNERAVEILAANNVDCYATLILGIDWGERDFEELYKWLKKMNLRFVNLQPFTPLPGTPPFDKYKEELIIPRNKYERWDLANLVVKPSKLSLQKYYFNILKLYLKITLSPKSVLKNLQYGIMPNLKLSMGVARVTLQYVKKALNLDLGTGE